jgi:glycerophosphoryl diester phosphodiesterase
MGNCTKKRKTKKEMTIKRTNIIFVLLLCALQVVTAQNRAEEIRNKLLNRDHSTVLVASHRGDWRNAPENSLAAIDNAIKMGVDIVEIDVERTKDGQFILMHDSKLDRTTTGKGLISEWTLDSIRTLKLKNGCAIKTKEKVPTLEEALLHAKGKIMLNLDKSDRYFDGIYELMEKTGTTKQIIMKGSKTPQKVKELYGKYLNDVIYMPVVDLDKENAAGQIKMFVDDFNPVAFELLYKEDTNTLPFDMAKFLNGKSLIWYNTLWDTLCGGHDDDMGLEDCDAAYGYLINTLGAHIIQTDRPARLIEYLQGKGLHN